VAASEIDQPLYVAKAELFRALGHPARIRILELLVEADQPVSQLLLQTGLEPSSLSQHLAILKNTGLVESSRKGNAVTYKVTDPSIGAFLLAARSVLVSTLGRARQTLEDLEGPRRGPSRSQADSPPDFG
jgi:ArsR family transcriptional regulator